MQPEPIEFFADRDCTKKIGDAIDLGSYDLAQGAHRTIYVRNNRTHLKAVLGTVEVKDLSRKGFKARSAVDMPQEILPGEVRPILINLPAVRAEDAFASEESELAYFENIFDQISGLFKWAKA